MQAGRRAGGRAAPFSGGSSRVKGLSREFPANLDFLAFHWSGLLACWSFFRWCDHFLGWRFFARRGGLARFFLFGGVFVLVRGQKRVVRRLVGVRECLGWDGWVGVNFVPSPRTPLLLLLLIGLTLADLG